MSLERIFDQAFPDRHYDSMKRDRPYDGQPHTDTGERGKTEVRGVTFRDLHDCLLRAFFMAGNDQFPVLYEEALKGENGLICENDLFRLDLSKIDPLALVQNFCCEVERVMGIFPNVPKLERAPPTPESKP